MPKKTPKKSAVVSPTTAPSIAARCLNVEGAAAYLGAHVHAIRELVWKRKVPFFRLGHRILFDKADLDTYVQNQKAVSA